MGQDAALKLAIDLFQLPSQANFLRSAPIPEGVSDLLRIAAGDQKAVSEACELTRRASNLVQDASAFYVEQVLLHPGADSYRVLGVRPDASQGELRRNMALLLRWLHPDSDRRDGRMVFASRVTEAWNNVKTKERRARYDRSLAGSVFKTSHRHQRRGAQSNNARHDHLGPQSMTQSKFDRERHGQRPRNTTDLYQYIGPFRRIFLFLFGRGLR